MAQQARVEKFRTTELAGLQERLSQSAFDTWHAAEVISEFLTGRGYGTCTQRIRRSLLSLERTSDLARIQEELEKLAYAM